MRYKVHNPGIIKKDVQFTLTPIEVLIGSYRGSDSIVSRLMHFLHVFI
jgi:hypothetical protein